MASSITLVVHGPVAGQVLQAQELEKKLREQQQQQQQMPAIGNA